VHRSTRVERRLAAILAVDVAGYSRLMGEDEEGTLAALRVAHLGHLDGARAEFSRMLAIDRTKLTVAGFRAFAHLQAPEVLELFVTGLRLAGLPEK